MFPSDTRLQLNLYGFRWISHNLNILVHVLCNLMFKKKEVLVKLTHHLFGSSHRRIENPRIVLLDCSLEYKKGESQVNCRIML